MALKVAAVVAAVSVAGGIGLAGAREIEQSRGPATWRPPKGELAQSVRRPSAGAAGSRTQAKTKPAARLHRAGGAAAGANHGKATATHAGTHTGAAQSASAPGHVKASANAGEGDKAHALSHPTHPPTTGAGSNTPPAKPADTSPPATSLAKTDGKATAHKPTKTPATPAIPALSEGSKTRATQSTPAVPASSSNENAGGPTAADDPAPSPKSNGKAP